MDSEERVDRTPSEERLRERDPPDSVRRECLRAAARERCDLHSIAEEFMDATRELIRREIALMSDEHRAAVRHRRRVLFLMRSGDPERK